MSQVRLFFEKSKSKWKTMTRLRKFTTMDLLCESRNFGSLEHKTPKNISNSSTEFPSTLFDSMTDNAMRNSDSVTLNKLVEQAIEVDDNFGNSVEKAILFYLWENDTTNAMNVLKNADSTKVQISEVTCQHLLMEIVEQFQWDSAHLIVSHMIFHDYYISSRDLSLVVSGLMETTEGVEKSLKILQLIIEKRRSDLARTFPFRRITKLSLVSGSPYHDTLLATQPLEQAMERFVAAIREDGWFSFNICKFLVAVACSSNYRSLSVDFIRHMLDSVQNDPHDRGASSRDRLLGLGDDSRPILLSSLEAVFHGDRLAQRLSYTESSMRHYRGFSEVTLAILDSLVYRLPHMGLVSGSKENLRTITDFVFIYWSLAFRCKHAAVSSHQSCSNIPPDVIDSVHSRQMTIYSTLSSFLTDSRSDFETFSPASSYDRRLMRYMTDELGLAHKTVYVEDRVTGEMNYTISVSRTAKNKGKSSWVLPVSYADLMQDDSKRPENQRRFEGEPLYWPVLRNFLLRLSDDSLYVVSSKLVLRSVIQFPSASWVFLMVDLLRQRDIPIPPILFSCAIRMCANTHDVYGVIELLHIAKIERARLNEDGAYRQRRIAFEKRIHPSDRNTELSSAQEVADQADHGVVEARSDDRGMEESNVWYRESDPAYYAKGDGADGSPVEVLSRADWNMAVKTAFRSKATRILHESYKLAFTEVMRMMRESGVSLDDGTMFSLLRFLATTDANEEMLVKLVRRIARDDSYSVSYVECLSMTMFLKKRIDKERNPFRYASPMFNQQNYLIVEPDILHEAVESFVRAALRMGEESVRPFEAIYSKTNTPAGREALFFYLSDLIQKGHAGKRHQIVSNSESLASVSVMCIYSAYLVAAHDGEFRHAFNLLCEVEMLFAENEEMVALRKRSRLSDEDYEEN